jgi:hypothetical protein
LLPDERPDSWKEMPEYFYGVPPKNGIANWDGVSAAT